MARREVTIAIEAEGRDHGKVFKLREMPASQAEKWAAKAFLALARSGVDVPADIASAGLAGIAALGIRAFAGLSFADAEPLLDEMWTCISFIPDPSRPQIVRGAGGIGPLVDDDIEEVATRLKLRAELLKLHTDFFTAGPLSTSEVAAPTQVASRNTPTSRVRSAR
jgi:hypothetical protein